MKAPLRTSARSQRVRRCTPNTWPKWCARRSSSSTRRTSIRAASASTPRSARPTRKPPTTRCARASSSTTGATATAARKATSSCRPTPTRTTIDEALAEHPDNDDLLAARRARRDAKQVQAVLRSGERVTVAGRRAAVRGARARCQGRAAASASARGADHPGAARRQESWQIVQLPEVGGGVRLARPAGRRDPRAGRRLRLQPQQVQPRHAGLAPAGLVVQALHLLGVAGEGLHAGDRGPRRAGRGRGRAVTGSQRWEPKNYDGKFEGPMRLRTALAKSKNMVSIRILQSDRAEVRAGLRHALRLRAPTSIRPT